MTGPSVSSAAPGGVLETRLCLGALLVVALIGFATAPLHGEYWWSDAPRHALNGAFILDLIRDRPFGDPVGYAYAYYLRYPALTILFYPPLLYVVIAAAFAAFGISALVAQAVVAIFHFVLLAGIFLLARRWLRAPYAFGAALIAGAGPELMVWSRQVMLDVPAYALLVVATVFFLRWLEHGRALQLYLCSATLLAAIYIKFNVGLIVIPYALALLAARGWRGALDRHIWINAALASVALIPAAVMLLKFGGGNIDSVVGSQTTDLPRASLKAWTFYLEALPFQLGWPALVLVPIGAVLALRARSIPLEHRMLIASWWIVGYLVFSVIALREPRHSLITLAPLGILAMFAVQQAESRIGRLAPIGALVLALGTTAWGVFANPAPAVAGHAEAARIVTKHARPGENILFHGYRDGSFVFAMRALGTGHRTVRADKFLVKMFIARERGLEDRGMSREDILALIRKYGIRHIVAEAQFWVDVPSFARFDELLRDRSLFAEIARLPITANIGTREKELVILRFLGDVDDPPAPITLEMMGLGRTISAP